MNSKCFTSGIYEDRPPYFGFLAEAARNFVRNGPLEEVNILWYHLNPKLLRWTEDVKRGQTDRNSYPFGEKPYLINLTKKDDKLPGEAVGLKWSDFCDELYGQKDIPPDYKADDSTPGKFWEIKHQAQCPHPNVIVVDHELFRKETAEAHSPDGSAHLIIEGLRQYYGGGESDTPPIFLSSYRPLADEAGLDTLGIGRGRGTRLSWFPRSDEKRPTKLPDGFTHALREEVNLWVRNRELLGAKYGRNNWISYNPPFDRIIVHYDQKHFTLNGLGFEAVVRGQELSPDNNADALLAQHCKAYLEIRRVVTQADVKRLRRLAERLPLPIVLLYLNTDSNVSNLGDCGVLADHVKAHNGDSDVQVEGAAIKWVRRMAALDTVVGGERLREIRDDLLRWRLSSQQTSRGGKSKPVRQGMLVVGRTGAGKTAVSRWCHFFSNHIRDKKDDVRDMWKEIPVPNPALKPNVKFEGPAVMTLEKALTKDNKANFLRAWAETLIKEDGKELPKGDIEDLLDIAFRTANTRPRQVNLVGVTGHEQFVIQIAGAFPSWTGANGVNDWRAGAVLSATNNSLILNEIGELESDAQGLLLELIERDGPIRPLMVPIGGEVMARNVLFIMATDRVDRIREQLLHRCRTIRVPSLLECQDDIPELARHRLLPRWCCLSERAEQLLRDWPYWPGNHRSLHAVLDFAAERLPSNRRMIRVPDVIRALWRENLIRVPSRLESLVKWILEWPGLDADRSEGPVVSYVIDKLTELYSSDWAASVERLNRIAEMSLKSPSAHFTKLLNSKNPEKLTNHKKFLSEAIGLLIHELFWTIERSVGILKGTIESAAERKDRIKRLVETPDTDFEHRLTGELRDDALVTLSIGTLLWGVLEIAPKDVAEANKKIRERPRKASGKTAQGIDNSGENLAAGQAASSANKTFVRRKNDGEPGNFDDSKISTTARQAGQYALAVLR